MIDPKHECWQSRQCSTEIIRAGQQFAGAGVSLRVLMHAFAGQDLVWFSAIYGMHSDNCVAYAVDPEIAVTLQKVPAEGVSPIQSAGLGDFNVEEYALAESVQRSLGVVIEQSKFDEELHDENKRDVSCTIYVHDDCFFTVAPVDTALLRRLIDCILQQHSFYLKQEVDWSPVLERIVEIVTGAPAVEIKSDARRKRLKLTTKKPGVQMMDALFGRRKRYYVEITGGVARFVR